MNRLLIIHDVLHNHVTMKVIVITTQYGIYGPHQPMHPKISDLDDQMFLVNTRFKDFVIED